MNRQAWVLVMTGLIACGKVATKGSSGDDDGSPDAPATGTIELSPPALDFGEVSIAVVPSLQTVTLTNHSDQPASASFSISGADATSFSILHDTCDAPIDPGASCTVDVAILVSHDGAYAASIDAKAGGLQASSMIAATSVTASLSMSPTSDVFGDVLLGASVTHQYTLANNGQAPLPTPTIEVTGAAYTVDASLCPAMLGAGATCVVSVTFQSSALGTQSSTLTATIGPLSAGCGLIARGTAKLTASKLGTGVGTVSGPGADGLDCGTTCTITVASSPITITAAETAGSSFTGWAGGAAGCMNRTCDVAITSAAVTAIANFTDLPTLTVSVANGAMVSGSVAIDNTGNGQPGSCTDDCAFDYPAATTVRLTAIEDIDVCRRFDGWSGACFGQLTTSCTLTVSGNMSTSAGFSRKPNCNPK
ncbi:MAG TPA: choice-of-anchor D domain-containing protein [Kofleriaceae bacterium]|jgi:hypothetical protein|nr:choice-of-anchor D domain-containing protein [Kofleriaceae bacterium]